MQRLTFTYDADIEHLTMLNHLCATVLTRMNPWTTLTARLLAVTLQGKQLCTSSVRQLSTLPHFVKFCISLSVVSNFVSCNDFSIYIFMLTRLALNMALMRQNRTYGPANFQIHISGYCSNKYMLMLCTGHGHE